eukprot:1579995-Pyramimonas_sp.AAC.1
MSFGRRPLRASSAPLGAAGRHLGGILGPSWGPLGAILGPLRTFWALLGAILEGREQRRGELQSALPPQKGKMRPNPSENQ